MRLQVWTGFLHCTRHWATSPSHHTDVVLSVGWLPSSLACSPARPSHRRIGQPIKKLLDTQYSGEWYNISVDTIILVVVMFFMIWLHINLKFFFRIRVESLLACTCWPLTCWRGPRWRVITWRGWWSSRLTGGGSFFLSSCWFKATICSSSPIVISAKTLISTTSGAAGGSTMMILLLFTLLHYCCSSFVNVDSPHLSLLLFLLHRCCWSSFVIESPPSPILALLHRYWPTFVVVAPPSFVVDAPPLILSCLS